jgi:hypothetical protein
MFLIIGIGTWEFSFFKVLCETGKIKKIYFHTHGSKGNYIHSCGIIFEV